MNFSWKSKWCLVIVAAFLSDDCFFQYSRCRNAVFLFFFPVQGSSGLNFCLARTIDHNACIGVINFVKLTILQQSFGQKYPVPICVTGWWLAVTVPQFSSSFCFRHPFMEHSLVLSCSADLQCSMNYMQTYFLLFGSRKVTSEKANTILSKHPATPGGFVLFFCLFVFVYVCFAFFLSFSVYTVLFFFPCINMEVTSWYKIFMNCMLVLWFAFCPLQSSSGHTCSNSFWHNPVQSCFQLF